MSLYVYLYSKADGLIQQALVNPSDDVAIERYRTRAEILTSENNENPAYAGTGEGPFPGVAQIQDAVTGELRAMTDLEKSQTDPPLLVKTAMQKFDAAGRLISKTRAEMIADGTLSVTALRAEKKLAVDALRATTIEGKGVTYNGVVFDTDARSREIISGLTAHVGGGGVLPQGFVFRARDNTDVVFTANDVKALAAAVIAMVNAVYSASWTIKAQIDALTTGAAIDGFDINQGWP